MINNGGFKGGGGYAYVRERLGIVSVKDFGAAGNGVTDDTAAIQAALNALQIGGPHTMFLPAGTYLISTSLSLPSFPHAIIGDGRDTAFLKATASITAILQGSPVTKSFFRGFYMNCNGLADYGISLTLSPESSAQNRLEWLGGANAKTFLYNLVGTEDTVMSQCSSQGNEGDPSTIAPALNVQVPNGAIYLEGCTLFGKSQFAYQLLSIINSTIGPVVINNAANTLALLKVTGCYLYDGDGLPVISSSGDLTNIDIDTCYVVNNAADSFISGNMLGGNTIRSNDSLFIVTNANTSSTVTIGALSGTGKFALENVMGRVPAGQGLNAFQSVNSGTVVPSMINASAMGLPDQTITPPAVPLVSGTVYQNTAPVPITIYQPVYATTSGTAGSIAVALGSSDTPSTLFTDYVPGDTSATVPKVEQLRVPPGWYYSFTVTNATLNDAQIQGE